MKNTKSTVAMQLAHKIAKQFPKLSFKTSLLYAWKLTRRSLDIAQKVLDNGYKVKVIKINTILGVSTAIQFVKVGFKAALKSLLGITNKYTVSLWYEEFAS